MLDADCETWGAVVVCSQVSAPDGPSSAASLWKFRTLCLAADLEADLEAAAVLQVGAVLAGVVEEAAGGSYEAGWAAAQEYTVAVDHPS